MSEERPNIVLIMTDQQRFDTINALGFPHCETPHLDRLVNEGVTLSNCHVTAASCAPARASLFTGYFPHTTGVLKNGDPWRHSWVEDLNEAGYHCVNIGKMHTFPFETPLGFHERYVVENKDRYLEGRYYFDEWDKALAANGLQKQQREQYRKLPDYKERLGAFEWELPEHLHSDMFVGEMACWWLNTYPKTEPLFLQIGFPGPHPPYDPTQRFIDLYKDKEIPIDPVSKSDLDSQPLPYREMIQHNCDVDHDSVVHQWEPTEEQRKQQRAYYLANVTMIDEKVGQILQTLEDQGYLENTIVIFTSDHGDCLGDHGHSQKWTMYDLITRVPTIVWAPGRFPQGLTQDALCQQMDLGPTILELAGIEPEPSMEAISLLPFIEGEQEVGRDFVYCEQCRDGILQTTDFTTMVRDQKWKLVHFLGESFGQLFNLKDDPKEEKNLWDEPECQTEKQRLLDQLCEWRMRSQYETRNWSSAWR
ncbi:Arylsulfatase A [Planctomycetales bacterium 10988]|nr:Arylsulfatase A [Planctomycetales bacterium 10988]